MKKNIKYKYKYKDKDKDKDKLKQRVDSSGADRAGGKHRLTICQLLRRHQLNYQLKYEVEIQRQIRLQRQIQIETAG